MGTNFNQGRIRQQKEMDGLPFSYAKSKIQWASNPNCPSAARLLRIFTHEKYLNLHPCVCASSELASNLNITVLLMFFFLFFFFFGGGGGGGGGTIIS